MLRKYKLQSRQFASSLLIVVGLSSIALTATTVFAEVIKIPDTPQSFSVTLPGRGMSMTEVLEEFGEPLSKDPEVGEPPISRWNYPNYRVIFEYQYVIHSLTTNKPIGLMQPQSSGSSDIPETNQEDNQATPSVNDGSEIPTQQIPLKSSTY